MDRAAEGRAVRVAYHGPVENTIQEVLGGVRSTCTYVGTSKLKDLPKCTTFVRVTQQINPMFGAAGLSSAL
jgi:GMP reductase